MNNDYIYRSFTMAELVQRCIDLGINRVAMLAERSRLRAELAECKQQAVRIYNSGYHAGHHDTVEGCYTHILPCDMSTYHDDVVAALAAKEE